MGVKEGEYVDFEGSLSPKNAAPPIVMLRRNTLSTTSSQYIEHNRNLFDPETGGPGVSGASPVKRALRLRSQSMRVRYF